LLGLGPGCYDVYVLAGFSFGQSTKDGQSIRLRGVRFRLDVDKSPLAKITGEVFHQALSGVASGKGQDRHDPIPAGAVGYPGVKIYDDAMASIKTNGLLGDRYVKIDAGGGGGLLKAGATITDTEPPVDIMELISKYAFGDVEKKQSKESK